MRRVLLALSIFLASSGVAEAQFAGAYGPLTQLPQLTVSSASLQAAANPGTNPPTNFVVIGLTGGAALSGNNTGGTAAAITITGGPGGTSTGSAANANGQAISLAGGAAGTGGGGAAGAAGSLNFQTTSTGNVIVGDGTPLLASSTGLVVDPDPSYLIGQSLIWNPALTTNTSAFGLSELLNTPANATAMATVSGLGTSTTYNGTNSLAELDGLVSDPNQAGTGTIASLAGVFVDDGGSGSGTITNAYGVKLYHGGFSGNTTTNYYGFFSDTQSGTITNYYGDYINALPAGGTIRDAFLYNGSTPVLISGTGGLEVGGTANAVAGVVTSTNGNRTIPANLSVFGTCNAAAAGTIAYQNDAASCVTGATAANGGAVFCQIVCNGSNWIQQANAAAGSSSYDWSYVFEANEPLNLWANGTILSMQNHGAGYTSFAGGTSPAYAIVTKAGDGGAGNLVVQICNGNTLSDNVCRTVLYTCTIPCNSVAQAFITCAVTNASTANVATHPVMYEVFSSCGTLNPIVNMSATFSTP